MAINLVIAVTDGDWFDMLRQAGPADYPIYWNEVTEKTRPDGKPVVETTTIMTNTVGDQGHGWQVLNLPCR